MNSGHLYGTRAAAAVLLLLTACFANLARGQVNFWIGPTGPVPVAGANGVGDWEVPSYWSLGVVPNTPSNDVRIDDNPIVDSEVTVNQTQTIGSLIIDLGDGLIVEPAVSLQTSDDVQNSGSILVRVNNTGGLEFASLFENRASGNVELEGGVLTALSPSAVGGALLHNVGTVQGNGRIGLSNRAMSIANEGMIDANRAGSTLFFTGIGDGTLNLSLPTYSNSGTLRASSGGTLRVSGFQRSTPLINDGGQIEASSGSTVTLLNTRIEGGSMATRRTGRVGEGRVRIGSQVSLVGVEVDGQVDFDFNSSLYDSDFENLQTLHLGSNQLFINETVRIAGGGQMRLAAGGQIRGDGAGASPPRFVNVDNRLFMDMTGTAAIGAGMLVENGGTIEADSPGRQLSLNLIGPAMHSPQEPAWMNSGSINATSGGRISLVGPARKIANGPTGVLEVNAASQFELGTAHILGGTLRGPAAMPSANNGFQQRATLENVRLEGFVGSPEPLELVGTIENSGTLFGEVEISTREVTLVGGGTVAVERFARVNTSQFVELVNEDNTIEVDGTVSLDTVQLVNRGIVEAVSASPSNQLVSSGAQPRRVINRGTMRAMGGNQLDLTGVVVQNHERDTNGDLFPGTILVGAGSTVLVGDVFGGRLVAETGGSLRAIDSNFNSTGLPVPLELSGIISAENLTFTGGIVNTGRLRAVGDTRVVSSSVLSGPGTLELGTGDGPGSLLIGENAFLQNASTHSIVGRGTITVDQTTLLNEGLIQSSMNGTLTLQGQTGTNPSQFVQVGSLVAGDASLLSIEGFGNFSNFGLMESRPLSMFEVRIQNGFENRSDIQVQANSRMTFAAVPGPSQLVENDGGEVSVGGTLSFINAHLLNRPGSVVFGDGSLTFEPRPDPTNSPIDFINQGVIAPGNIGELTISGSFEQTAPGRLEIGIGGTSLGEYDMLRISREAELAGELAIELVDLGGGIYELQLGDQFVILESVPLGPTITGVFDSLDAPTLDPGLDFRLFYNDSQVILSITEPFTSDFDGNSTINASDLDQWQADYGATDGLDFLAWQREVAQGPPTVMPPVVAVPEPSTALLFACVFVVMIGSATRCRS